jgi:hypothetical protein
MKLLRDVATGPDVLIAMLDELRQSRPPTWDGDAWMLWESAMGQTIAALKEPSQRWAATALVANDLTISIPGLCLSTAYGHVRQLVIQAGGTMEEERL